MADLWDRPPGQGEADSGGSDSELTRTLEDALGGTGGLEPDAGSGSHVFEPPPNWESYNAEQARNRAKAAADGVPNPELIYPDIDPENPERIN